LAENVETGGTDADAIALWTGFERGLGVVEFVVFAASCVQRSGNGSRAAYEDGGGCGVGYGEGYSRISEGGSVVCCRFIISAFIILILSPTLGSGAIRSVRGRLAGSLNWFPPPIWLVSSLTIRITTYYFWSLI